MADLADLANGISDDERCVTLSEVLQDVISSNKSIYVSILEGHDDSAHSIRIKGVTTDGFIYGIDSSDKLQIFNTRYVNKIFKM